MTESINPYNILKHTQRQRVGDGQQVSILTGCDLADRLLVLVLPQLGDFDSLEYAWWVQKYTTQLQKLQLTIRAIGIGDRASGQTFCAYTGFSPDWLFVDPTAELHRELGLYRGRSLRVPRLFSSQNAWFNLMLMCAGISSPGTLAEVF